MESRVRWRGHSDASTNDSCSSQDSDQSYQSPYTADTVCSDRPKLQHYETCMGRVESHQYESMLTPSFNSRESSETYVSTEPSEYDEFSDNEAEFELLDFPDEDHQSDALPATPRDFADLFPSARRMDIRHDDSTMDGNMNLRIDTQVESGYSKQKCNITLFHLKMQDLKNRDFSLRRYCRDSGREVCHSVRMYQAPISERRPSFTKSFSSAIAQFRKHSDHKINGIDCLRRHDSGYGSVFDQVHEGEPKTRRRREQKSRPPTNTVKLEFANYAHVDVKRRGAGISKSYDFEYWGFSYSWVRNVNRVGIWEEVSYHLVRKDKTSPLAHIVPVLLTTAQKEEERLKGGWVPPCSMWIKDEDILQALPDVADVVVSTGIMALVDDSIKRRWHSKRHRQMLRPLSRGSSFGMNFEHIGPKRLIDGVFNRRGTTEASPMRMSDSTEV
ncbi:Tripeptidyl-peptidase sed2 [Venturia nashicola]|uniref:Tripeptidyl-peptidase sed2 n=1 Tax=Venturia nashicola TaxID=86259 RepID=A0A4Z1PM38_9PEZI|nr:Tripeptidyl-peptidase sed2 [Venturia nashicola]